MGRDERLRLFLAYVLPADAVDLLVAWQQRELRGRLVPPGNLHVTLAFLGSRPAAELRAVVDVLAAAARDAAPPELEVVAWRERRSAGMLELRDRTGTNAAQFAGRLQNELAGLGLYRPETRDWLPHVTLLRYREPPRLRPRTPGLAFVPSDAAAFLSRLHPAGARYEVLKSFPLGG